MPRKLRFLPESLEGRSLLSFVSPKILPNGSWPETVSFAPTPLVSQQATSVTVTLIRSAFGTQGVPTDALQAHVYTMPDSGWIGNARSGHAVPPTGLAGVHYQAIDEVITFPPGVSAETFSIPIVAGAPNPGEVSFEVAASTSYSGSNYSSEEIHIAKDASAPVPKIVGSHFVVTGKSVTGLAIRFDQPMVTSSVENLDAYSVENDSAGYRTPHVNLFSFFFPSRGPSTIPKPVSIKSAIYDPSTNTVVIHLLKPLSTRGTYTISSTDLLDPLTSEAGRIVGDGGTGVAGSFLITVNSRGGSVLG